MSNVVDVPSTIVVRALLRWKMPMTLDIAITVVILARTIRARLYDIDALHPTFRPSKNTSHISTSAEIVSPLFLDR